MYFFVEFKDVSERSYKNREGNSKLALRKPQNCYKNILEEKKNK